MKTTTGKPISCLLYTSHIVIVACNIFIILSKLELEAKLLKL